MARVVLPDFPHHITQRGVRSLPVFHSDDDRVEYLKLQKEQGERFGVSFISYCLMDNHVHLVAIPSDETGLARAIGEAHRLYTRRINFREKVRGAFFLVLWIIVIFIRQFVMSKGIRYEPRL